MFFGLQRLFSRNLWILWLQGFHWIKYHVWPSMWLACLIKYINLPMYLHVHRVYCWTFCLDLNQKVPFVQDEIFVKSMGSWTIPYFDTWIGKFHQNYKVFIDVLGRATSRSFIEIIRCLFVDFGMDSQGSLWGSLFHVLIIVNDGNCNMDETSS